MLLQSQGERGTEEAENLSNGYLNGVKVWISLDKFG